ncbi:MAG: excinuclease ABC subunit UvrB [Candidatus Jettenia sp.]|uniref:UvrABC system protein B n=1 Tax=Candidatus Jettenia caeni TaxID=247490 RepID=I3IJ00_9BACT|nr:excinuclease ABC subunit UvrB [Candidatus Jettenia sp. AMX1]MBC6930295.1 excinuclease ABC subunit UvrB [Candidatus Jettenia sp.]WKZ17010.1 MAG: excinuclease ABC subunit UvrB [Candidatus Jettenia caeni]KAA0247918.1 MAG: excinuclease ABC subunit UvrB [Candidatus Jettenia sp. AMX1]MCE7881666.1 excinuclease ABC subunit UvrB [Candidatus Jettenia sp. AMX1]MCQ3928313.1 excinuclease ABC subunit UvrB [Candidatus Jettenia sp.]
MSIFKLVSSFTPQGDQPRAIQQLVESYKNSVGSQTLLGVTGSGKTFTMANVIAALGKPTLVMTHNKTLAAQLYSEFKSFFPENAVGYFVSYYDYYQPEAYIPQRDIYIEKESTINQEIDRLRLLATSALMSRRDVIIIASVSCIYGLGSPEEYQEMYVHLCKGDSIERNKLLRKLVSIQYERNDIQFIRGSLRVRGDVVEVFPAYEEIAYRIELFGNEVDKISKINPMTGNFLQEVQDISIYPAKHFVMPEGKIEGVVRSIEYELNDRLKDLRSKEKFLEAQRLEARTRYDMEMLLEVGYCHGIENYSRHLSGRAPGETPYTLFDYFPKDFFLIIDESHVSIPQIGGMYHGDRARKEVLVEYGFRLPSALDNRPLRFDEWESKIHQILFVSATPGSYELKKCHGTIVEQIIRPTGLVDPIISVKPAKTQIEDLLKQIRSRAQKKERVLVTTLTKRLAEDLSEYIKEEGLKGMYLHSELNAIERVTILRDLRLGKFDVLVGVNLLREGLDLPEVSFVAILDADKEGFLRSETSLIQTIGRTARNVNAEVILYADEITNSMKRAMDETNRRRTLQIAYNKKHNITPATIQKEIKKGIEDEVASHKIVYETVAESEEEYITQEFVNELEEEMLKAAEALQFERAAELRDKIQQIR